MIVNRREVFEPELVRAHASPEALRAFLKTYYEMTEGEVSCGAGIAPDGTPVLLLQCGGVAAAFPAKGAPEFLALLATLEAIDVDAEAWRDLAATVRQVVETSR